MTHRNAAHPLWRIVSGAVRDAMNSHPEFEIPTPDSITKRIVGQLLSPEGRAALAAASDGVECPGASHSAQTAMRKEGAVTNSLPPQSSPVNYAALASGHGGQSPMTEDEQIDQAATQASRAMGIWIADHGSDDAARLWDRYNDAIQAWGHKNSASLTAAYAHVKRLQAAIERDRATVASIFGQIRSAIGGRAWMTETRGSYAYDDERFMAEFGCALTEIERAAEPLRSIARDWSDCPESEVDIARARAQVKPVKKQSEEHDHSVGAADIARERERQMRVEGWTPEHDDAHKAQEIATAALCYLSAVVYPDEEAWTVNEIRAPLDWPWEKDWWKPGRDRSMLVKAGALIAAEIDRLDRADAKIGGCDHG